MTTFMKPEGVDNDQQDQQGAQNPLEPVTTAQGEGGGVGVQGAGQQAQDRAPTSSGSFTNVEAYRKANTPAAQQFAKNVTSKLQDQITAGQQQVQEGVSQGTGGQSFDYQGKSLQELSDQGAGQFLGSQFKGPAQVGGLQDIQAARQAAETANKFGGLQQTLQGQMQGVQDYSAGERRLDAMLLGGQGARQQIAGLAEQARSAEEQALADIAGFQEQAGAAEQQFGEQQAGLRDYLQQQYQQIDPSVTADESQARRTALFQDQGVQDLLNQKFGAASTYQGPLGRGLAVSQALNQAGGLQTIGQGLGTQEVANLQALQNIAAEAGDLDLQNLVQNKLDTQQYSQTAALAELERILSGLEDYQAPTAPVAPLPPQGGVGGPALGTKPTSGPLDNLV